MRFGEHFLHLPRSFSLRAQRESMSFLFVWFPLFSSVNCEMFWTGLLHNFLPFLQRTACPCVWQYSECFGPRLCPWINAFFCVHLPSCTFQCAPDETLLSLFFFYVLKAILRVTFQKPGSAALLSMCGRLSDSVWVRRAQGYISGPLQIPDFHGL